MASADAPEPCCLAWQAWGGERGIAKTPMLYRMWSRIVQKEVRDWEAAVVADWDCATVGSSAFKTALLRNYKTEIASALGESCAANLWDLHKFFDTVVPSELFSSALELGFPKHVLALGLDMHMAPRVIQLEGCCSEPIAVARSILAGYGLSIPFTRAFLRTALQEVASATSADQTVYVDDVAQCASGTLSQVVEALVQAAVVFHRSVRKLRPTVSAKSIVCGSSPKLVRLLTGELRDLGITVKAAPYARDLGLSFSPGRRRHASIQLKRISGAAVRFKNIGGLVKTNRRARSLVRMGALPQALWGQTAQGLAPSRVSALRTLTAAATGIIASGRCGTTAIALALGPSADPGISNVKDQVATWVSLWGHQSGLHHRARSAWPIVHRRTYHVSGETFLGQGHWPDGCHHRLSCLCRLEG